MQQSIVLATRKSALALAQARAWAADFQRQTGTCVTELHVTTTGDRIVDRALSEVGGKGLFIKEIEEALLDGRADIAVHSLKDVPAELAPGLTLACIPEREDPRDVLVSRSGRPFAELPAGSRVGTSSLRRMVQLKIARPDLDYVPIRGNVDTRLRRCEEGVVDAVVLALSGMKRLGLASRATEVLEPTLTLPAIGQGALAIECRADDGPLIEVLGRLEHRSTRIAVSAERGVMKAVQGNCQVPVAGFAVRRDADLWLRGLYAATEGSAIRQGQISVPWPADAAVAFALGEQLGASLLG